jgi:putative ATP-binding cassette transporter
MELIKFLNKESPSETFNILILSTIYAITTALFGPILLNAVADIIAGQNYLFWLCLLSVCITIQILTYRTTQSRTARLAESGSEKLVLHIANTLRLDELSEFERRDPSEIYLTLKGTRSVTDGAIQSIVVLQNILITFILWFYLFCMNKLAGVILLLIFGWVILAQEMSQRIGADVFQKTVSTEERLFDIFHHFLNGFKEIKVCKQKNADLFENFLKPLIEKIQVLRYKMVFFTTEFMVATITAFSIFMAIEVFFLRSMGASLHLLMITLYADKFFWPIITNIAMIHDGQAALARLNRFAAEKKTKFDMDPNALQDDILTDFHTLKLKNIHYTYHENDGTSGFSIGPVSLSLRNGELIFLAGGNGSGKSTLVKLLTGLYPHESGTIELNGNSVDLKDYRYLFSAIFSDYHLFDALYGLESPDDSQVYDLLEKMQLNQKTDYRESRFTTRNLSAGQCRRMAMVITLLEDKPIYVFDEWAADQDPYFRQYFYEELLPLLKEKGKTVLAVTHDDAYYSVADRVIYMKDGRFEDLGHPENKVLQNDFSSDVPSPLSDFFFKYTDSKDGKPFKLIQEQSHSDEPLIQMKEYKPFLLNLGWLSLIDVFLSPLRLHILLTAAILSAKDSGSQLFFMFIIATLLDFVVTRKFNHNVVTIVEKAISTIRIGIIDRVRKISMVSFERISAERVYTILTTDLKAIADISFFIGIALKFTIRMIGLIVYFAFLAFPFFMVSAFIAGGIGIFYILNQVQIKMAIDKLREEETAFLDAMTHLIDGFKELRLNDFKSNSFFHTCIKPLYSRLKSLRLESARYLLINQEIVYGTWALLLGMLPLVFPFVNVSDSSLHICISILFFFPIGILLDAIPSVLQTLVSVQRLWEMKQELEVTELDYANIISKEDRAPFSELCYQDIIFHYQTDENHSFSVGPINLSIHAGEILFITGGNGSGKSTLLKMITGLYASETGNIILNGKAVEIRQHRYLFSIIFSDFYLFDRLYGLPDVDENWVNELIKLMKLDKKVTFADGRFNTTDLSSGQKKRLALVAAILEDRPVYVFDEWAAEQDPHFRRYFYETLVPSFKSQGKTVIAITHHDQYFHLADRIIKMDYGRVCLH